MWKHLNEDEKSQRIYALSNILHTVAYLIAGTALLIASIRF